MIKLPDKCDASRQYHNNGPLFQGFSLLMNLGALPLIFSLAGELRAVVETSGVPIVDLLQELGAGGTPMVTLCHYLDV